MLIIIEVQMNGKSNMYRNKESRESTTVGKKYLKKVDCAKGVALK